MKKKIYGIAIIAVLFLTSLYSVNISKSEMNEDLNLRNLLALSSAQAEYPNGGCTCALVSNQVCCKINYSQNEWQTVIGYPI